MAEVWKDIKEYEGLYQVSNLGRIKKLENKIRKVINGKEYYSLYKEKLLKISNHNKNGYSKINLSKNGSEKTYQVHRLVAQAFIPNPQNEQQVNHKNGVKTDNRVENLEWVTISRNHKHAYEIGLKKPTCKEVIQYGKNNKFIKKWDSITKASKGTKICKTDICDCAKGKLKTAGGFKWKYISGESKTLEMKTYNQLKNI